MLPYGYTIWNGTAVTAALMAQRDALLRRLTLRPESCGQTVCVCPPSGQVAACGSLDGQVIKCVGVAPEEEGNGLAAEVVTALTRLALEQGETRLLLYTKPKNRTVFEGVRLSSACPVQRRAFDGAAVRRPCALSGENPAFPGAGPRGCGGDELQPHDRRAFVSD